MALNYRTKLGTALAVGVVVGLMSFMLSVMLLAVAAFLVAWGREPKQTEDFIGGLPGGAQLLKWLAQLDAALASRD
jgi:hypothetical protein